jgi:hypothetical protein
MKKRIQSIMGLLNLGLLFSSAHTQAKEYKIISQIPNPINILSPTEKPSTSLIISLEGQNLIKVIQSSPSADCIGGYK